VRCLGEARKERLYRVAVEAARQCGRGDAPAIDEATSLECAVEQFGRVPGLAGVCLDPSAPEPLGTRLFAMTREAHVVFVVGPEGGLSDRELAACARAGFVCASLGSLILRTETVCAAVLGALLVLRGVPLVLRGAPTR
jgi:16S rRNA (uracil1498-N3)-methyltransferase